jgi:hypothetical protein
LGFRLSSAGIKTIGRSLGSVAIGDELSLVSGASGIRSSLSLALGSRYSLIYVVRKVVVLPLELSSSTSQVSLVTASSLWGPI